MHRIHCGSVLLAVIVFVGCSSNPPPGGARLKTYPVKGIVSVDGERTESVAIKFHPQSGSAAITYPVSVNTVQGGAFSAATYVTGDGLPEGTYKLTFQLREEPQTLEPRLNLRTPPAPDRLKGVYVDPAKSTHEVAVKGGTIDLGVIELSTKGDGK